MTREQRRAGRAIRKARRLEAQRRAELERQIDILVDFARRTVEAISRFFAMIGAAARAAAEFFVNLGSLSRREDYVLAPPPSAVEIEDEDLERVEPTSVLDRIEIELAQETYESELEDGAPERAARAFDVVESLRSAEQPRRQAEQS